MTQALGVWVCISRDRINIATGLGVCISIITIFRQPLDVRVYFKSDCINITTGHICTCIDRNRIEIATTIIFIIFSDFLIFYEIFLSPQVKPCAIITSKHAIYEFPHEWRKDLRLRILGN